MIEATFHAIVGIGTLVGAALLLVTAESMAMSAPAPGKKKPEQSVIAAFYGAAIFCMIAAFYIALK